VRCFVPAAVAESGHLRVGVAVINLIAEDDRGVGRFTCSGTPRTWLGHSPTGTGV
jgi:hypothetical protein